MNACVRVLRMLRRGIVLGFCFREKNLCAEYLLQGSDSFHPYLLKYHTAERQRAVKRLLCIIQQLIINI